MGASPTKPAARKVIKVIKGIPPDSLGVGVVSALPHPSSNLRPAHRDEVHVEGDIWLLGDHCLLYEATQLLGNRGEGRIAVETHENMDPTGFMALLPERRAHHFIDLARGLAQIGDVARASEMLLEGDRLAPSEIRCRPIAHEVLSDVLRRTRGTPIASVAELAENMGVGV